MLEEADIATSLAMPSFSVGDSVPALLQASVEEINSDTGSFLPSAIGVLRSTALRGVENNER